MPYEVSTVIIHEGTPQSGHYFTTHFNSKENTWEKIDDQCITKLTKTEAKNLNKHGIIYVLKKTQVPTEEPNKHIKFGPPANKKPLETQISKTDQKNYNPPLINLSYSKICKTKNHDETPFPTENENKQINLATTQPRRKNPWSMVPKNQPNLPGNLNYTENNVLVKRKKNPWSMVPNSPPSTINDNDYPSLHQPEIPHTENKSNKENSQTEKRQNPWRMEPKISNKRYYVDRDNPKPKKTMCWWHTKNKCKFGDNCWYNHDLEQNWQDTQSIDKTDSQQNRNSTENNNVIKGKTTYSKNQESIDKNKRSKCWWDQQNRCKWGDKCWYNHENPQVENLFPTNKNQTPLKENGYKSYNQTRLMLSGDVEKNPGPYHSKTKKHQHHLIKILIMILITIGQIKKEQTQQNYIIEISSTQKINNQQNYLKNQAYLLSSQSLQNNENSPTHLVYLAYILTREHKNKETFPSRKSPEAFLAILLICPGTLSTILISTCQAMLLLLSGDIHPNPGPYHPTSCLNCNNTTANRIIVTCDTCTGNCHLNCNDESKAKSIREGSFEWLCPNPTCKPNHHHGARQTIEQKSDTTKNKYYVLVQESTKKITKEDILQMKQKLNRKNKSFSKNNKKYKTKTRLNDIHLSELTQISPEDYIGKDKCKICNKSIGKAERAISCDICDRWSHLKCSDMSTKSYKSHGRTEFPWSCTHCRKPEEMPETCETIKTKFNKSFLILHYNSRSLHNKEEEIHHICNELQPAILCITETWLDGSDGPQAYTPNGYSMIRQDRTTEFKQKYMKNNGGGVAILYKKELKIQKLKNLSLPEENLWVEIQTKPSFILGLVYRADYTELLKENENGTFLEQQLNEITTRNNNIVVVGDFNCNTATENTDNDTNRLIEIFDSFNMKQMINKPTRINMKTMKTTTIDHVWADTGQCLIKNTGTIEGISDHAGTYTVINCSKIKPEPEKIQYRCYKNYSTENFNQDLEISLKNQKLADLIEQEKVNEATEMWVKIFNETADIHAPIKEITINKKKSIIPWFTSELKELIIEKKRKLELYLMDGFQSDLHLVKALSNKITHIKRKLKKLYYTDNIQKYEKDPQKMWGMLKEVTQTHISKNETEPQSLDQTRANQFNSFFATVGTNIQKKLKIEEKILERIKPEKFNFKEEKEETIIKLIERIKPKVAVGYDNISAKLLKDSKHTIAKTLTQLINISYRKSIFPNCMKKGIVRPIFKKEDPEDPSNYRPLTILSTLSKVFERSAADQQMKYYLENQILNEFQHAYMKGHSTETCLNEMINYIYEELDQGNIVGVASLDLSKAFDSISHSHLIQKLSDLGLGEKSLKWCKSYLTNRRQQTKFKKLISTEETVTSGVPQGSIMGPILFISFINDLPENFKNCKIVSYADDTQILVSAKKPKQIKKSLENLIDNAQKWYAKNSLLNNTSKTETLLITGKKKTENILINITENGEKKFLKPKTSIKILGVHLDQNLSWDKQVNEVNKKAKYSARNLQRINMLIPLKSRLLLYNSLVASHLNYADTVWAG